MYLIGKKAKVEFNELTSVLSVIIGDSNIDKIMQCILHYAKQKVHFSTCTIYEMISNRKIKMIYTNLTKKDELLVKQKIVLANMKHFYHSDDIYPDKDENAIYHPVIINKELQYIFVFDDIEDIEGKKSKNYVSLCNDLIFLMSYIKNSCLTARTKYIDQCTGLANERQLRKDLQFCIENETDCIFAIVNIDNLETYNKLYGVSTGDAIIKNTADVIQKYIAKGEAAYRFFGDKLAIILFGEQDKHYNTLQSIINNIRTNGYTKGEKIIYYSVSIGALELAILKDLRFDNAYDRAMRAAKIEKGGVCFAGERRELNFIETLPNKSVLEAENPKKEAKKSKKTSSKKKKSNNNDDLLAASKKIDDGSYQGTNLFDLVSSLTINAAQEKIQQEEAIERAV